MVQQRKSEKGVKMNSRGNRIGTVSSVDTETGMVSVFYNGPNEATGLLPYITFNNEYSPPQVGSKVIVLSLSDGGSVVLGTYWSRRNFPENPGKYHKDFGGAYAGYADNVFTVSAEDIRFIVQGGKEVTIAKLAEDIEKIKQQTGVE